MPEAGLLEAGDVVLPVEVGLQVAGAAVVPVRRLHRLMDAPPIDGRRQHAHRPLALLSRGSRALLPACAPVHLRPVHLHPHLGGPLHADARETSSSRSRSAPSAHSQLVPSRPSEKSQDLEPGARYPQT